MKIVTAFPSFLAVGKIANPQAKSLNKQLTREIAILEKIDHAGRKWSQESYLAGYSSYSSLDKLHLTSPNLAELARRLRPGLRKFVDRLNWDLRGRALQMTTCWVNRMNQGCHHTSHTHPMAVVSGVYYVSVPIGSSPLKIEDPRLPLFMNAPARRASAPQTMQNYFSLPPQAGQFVLFESWMRHEVPPHRSRLPRLSVAFNYELKD